MESSPKRRKVSHNGDSTQTPSRASRATASPFVLQTQELLKEVKVDYSEEFEGADLLLKQLRDAIDSIPAQGDSPITDATRKFQKKHQIQIPFPDPKPAADSPYKLSYEKPAVYNVVGSYVSRTMVRAQSDKIIDMIVQMPQSIFQEKDYQNMRYFYRRSFYIANIAAGLRQKLGKAVKLEFENLNENQLLPVLRVRSTQPIQQEKEDGSEEDEEGDEEDEQQSKIPDYTIRIIPCAPEGLFAKGKLLASANCNKNDTSDAPTPFYNSTVKAEETFVTYLKVLAKARTQCAAFADACILGRVWLQQRGFGGSASQGGFGHFEWAIMSALLLQKGGRNGQAALSSSLSSPELFKATVQFLASTDFTKKPFTFGTCQRGNEAIREAGPVMLDVDRELNLMYKTSPWSANVLKHHANNTLEVLNSSSADQFKPTFITKTNLPLQMFDTVFDIEDVDLERHVSGSDRRGAIWNFSASAYTALTKGWKDRATLIDIQMPGDSSWPITTAHASKPSKSNITVGVLFDAASMAKPMEYGPSAELKKEAARFRQFWGDKAELRRFKDGSILECVPWTQKSAAGICQEIAQYVLKLHVGVDPNSMRFYGEEIPSGLEFSPVDKDAFDAARKAFQTFEHDIRSLEGMPLSVRRLAPICPELRYSAVEPPSLGYHQGEVRPMNATLSFEASSRWPENLVAIQETKIDFLLDIDRRLQQANDNITTSLGRDNVQRESDNLAYLDVVYDNGAAFRLRIHSDLEETLLEREAKNKTLDPHVRSGAEEALFQSKWQHTQLPLHTQNLASLCLRLPSLSPAIRMTKHWFNSHKLAGQVSEELIELLVLHVFLQPQPWQMPSSAQTGFLRTVLFLSRWDWRSEPLVVDFSTSDEMTHEDRTAVYQRLETWRSRDPNMNHAVLFVATNHESSGVGYTRYGPSKLAATRVTSLAKAACRLVREQGTALDIDELFEPSLGDYDVLIHLSSAQTKRVLRDAVAGAAGSGKRSAFKNLDSRTGKVPLPISRQPVDVLLTELESTYEDSLIFFRGARGDAATVGAIWQPKLRRQAFRVGLPFNLRSEGDDDEEEGGVDHVEINKEAVLLEIARIGGDLIKRIEIS